MEVVSFTIPQELLDRFDAAISAAGYDNRSEVLRLLAWDVVNLHERGGA